MKIEEQATKERQINPETDPDGFIDWQNKSIAIPEAKLPSQNFNNLELACFKIIFHGTNPYAPYNFSCSKFKSFVKSIIGSFGFSSPFRLSIGFLPITQWLIVHYTNHPEQSFTLLNICLFYKIAITLTTSGFELVPDMSFDIGNDSVCGFDYPWNSEMSITGFVLSRTQNVISHL